MQNCLNGSYLGSNDLILFVKMYVQWGVKLTRMSLLISSYKRIAIVQYTTYYYKLLYNSSNIVVNI